LDENCGYEKAVTKRKSKKEAETDED
jgi:hypothetical protein